MGFARRCSPRWRRARGSPPIRAGAGAVAIRTSASPMPWRGPSTCRRSRSSWGCHSRSPDARGRDGDRAAARARPRRGARRSAEPLPPRRLGGPVACRGPGLALPRLAGGAARGRRRADDPRGHRRRAATAARVIAGRSAGAVLVGESARGALAILRRDRGRTESPNAGWTMAAMAGALGVVLEKPGAYRLGDGALPVAADIERAVRVLRAAAGVSLVLTAT